MNTINGHPSNNPRGAEHLKWTIAHEIGHIFVGKGHPGLEEGGPAPLPGTDAPASSSSRRNGMRRKRG